MLDTTSPVSREVVITTGLFLFILVMGTFAFDLYTQGSNNIVLTGATVAQPVEEEPSNASNAITGAVVGITGAAVTQDDAEEVQIGVYEIEPHTAIETDTDLVSMYDELQAAIRLFHQEVDECMQTDTLSDCIEQVQSQEAYEIWLEGDACETAQEALFYDITDAIAQCLASEDYDCTCTYDLAYRPAYDPGEYYIEVIQEEDIALISLVDSDVQTTLPVVFYYEEEPVAQEDFTISVATSGVLASFATQVPDATLYVYKQDETTISIEDQTTYSTQEYTRAVCTTPEHEVRKFCVQDEAVVYEFALVFEG